MVCANTLLMGKQKSAIGFQDEFGTNLYTLGNSQVVGHADDSGFRCHVL